MSAKTEIKKENKQWYQHKVLKIPRTLRHLTSEYVQKYRNHGRKTISFSLHIRHDESHLIPLSATGFH